MRYLLQGDPAAPSQIAAATGLQRTNLSTILRGLEQQGPHRAAARPGRRPRRHGPARPNADAATTPSSDANGPPPSPTAADHDTTHLDAALALLTAVKDGLVRART